MSVRIMSDGLTEKEISKISSDLTFHSKPVWRYVGGRRRSYPSKPSLSGKTVVGNCFRVPRLYGLNNFPNRVVHNTHCMSAPFNFKGKLLDKQVGPVKESMNQLINYGCTLMAYCTGFGKSVCMAYIASKLRGLTLILVDGTVGNKQIPGTLKEFTDAKVWVVGKKMPPEANVVVCMDTRVKHLPADYLMCFTTVIIDEAHCWLTRNRYGNLFKVEPKYLILATSTPRDQEKLWPALKSFVGKNEVVVVFERPFNVFIYHTGIKVEIGKQKKTGNPDWTKLVKDLCNHPRRNEMIMQMVLENIAKGFKILILTWREYHAQNLVDEIKKHNILVSKFTGKNKSYNDAWCIVGTISKINKAFDEKAMCDNFAGVRINLVLLVGSTKSDVLMEQMVGRAFRAELPNIIHFVDDNRIIKHHLKLVRPWYHDTRRKATVIEVFAPNVKEGKNTTPRIVDSKSSLRSQASTFNFGTISEHLKDTVGYTFSGNNTSSSTTSSSNGQTFSFNNLNR